MKARRAVGIDLGGTDIKGGLVDDERNIVAQTFCPTPADRGPDAVIEALCGVVERLVGKSPVIGVGLGTPGPLSPSRGVVFSSVNLPGWHDIELRRRVAEKTGLPVVIDNDANMAAYGEYRKTPAEDPGDLVLLTLGTGVGSGTVLGGRIFHGHFENASEWGHLIVEPHNGRACNCGQRGCLEQYASAASVAKRVIEEMANGVTSSLAEAVASGQMITAVEVERAARAGDELSGRVWDQACRYLAVACVNIQHALNPPRVLLGGGMSRAGPFLLNPVRTHFNALRWKLCDDAPEIALAGLGNDAGIIGAAALAWDTFTRS